jgi:hypothetical protein
MVGDAGVRGGTLGPSAVKQCHPLDPTTLSRVAYPLRLCFLQRVGSFSLFDFCFENLLLQRVGPLGLFDCCFWNLAVATA